MNLSEIPDDPPWKPRRQMGIFTTNPKSGAVLWWSANLSKSSRRDSSRWLDLSIWFDEQSHARRVGTTDSWPWGPHIMLEHTHPDGWSSSSAPSVIQRWRHCHMLSAVCCSNDLTDNNSQKRCRVLSSSTSHVCMFSSCTLIESSNSHEQLR